MKMIVSRIFAVSVMAMMFAVATFAQNDIITAAAGDKYVISAKAGGVNLVEGTVGVVRQNGQSGRLIKGDKLEIGDRVSTDADGKAEILLNPGSYLRLGGNSVFEFKTTSLDNLQLELTGGSAILEVFAADEFRVVVNAPKVKYTLIESGIYRVDVTPSGGSRVAVWKGRAHVGNSADAVKGGREATFRDGQLAIAKFNRDDKDALEVWSKTRARDLVKISLNLERRALRTSLMQSFLGQRWNMYDSFGLWVYDPIGLSYCFLPFGQGWYSPYGYGFGRSIWHYNLPRTVYYPPSNPTTTSTNPDGSKKPRATSIIPADDRSGTPPFERMERNGGGRGIVDSPNHPKQRNTDPGPVYTPPIIVSDPPSDSSGGRRKTKP